MQKIKNLYFREMCVFGVNNYIIVQKFAWEVMFEMYCKLIDQVKPLYSLGKFDVQFVPLGWTHQRPSNGRLVRMIFLGQEECPVVRIQPSTTRIERVSSLLWSGCHHCCMTSDLTSWGGNRIRLRVVALHKIHITGQGECYRRAANTDWEDIVWTA